MRRVSVTPLLLLLLLLLLASWPNCELLAS
jgi:hypothetical protein